VVPEEVRNELCPFGAQMKRAREDLILETLKTAEVRFAIRAISRFDHSAPLEMEAPAAASECRDRPGNQLRLPTRRLPYHRVSINFCRPDHRKARATRFRSSFFAR
jgi:hypothetical protein